jgi:hypothetical protein
MPRVRCAVRRSLQWRSRTSRPVPLLAQDCVPPEGQSGRLMLPSARRRRSRGEGRVAWSVERRIGQSAPRVERRRRCDQQRIQLHVRTPWWRRWGGGAFAGGCGHMYTAAARPLLSDPLRKSTSEPRQSHPAQAESALSWCTSGCAHQAPDTKPVQTLGLFWRIVAVFVGHWSRPRHCAAGPWGARTCDFCVRRTFPGTFKGTRSFCQPQRPPIGPLGHQNPTPWGCVPERVDSFTVAPRRGVCSHCKCRLTPLTCTYRV